MKIPKEFNLMGKTIKVVYNDAISNSRGWMGMASRDLATITIAKTSPSEGDVRVKFPLDVIEHTFFHELTHQILYALNYEELNKDEQFVDNFAGLLHQALKTAKY